MIEIAKKTLKDRKDFFSYKIYLIDIIDSFKFRKKQAILSLLTALLFLGLGYWCFTYEVARDNWRGSSVVFFSFLYFPLLVSILVWFRGLSIYDLTHGMKYEEDKPRTKKDIRASLSFKISAFSFFFYYCYGIFRAGGIFWGLGMICLAGMLFFISKPKTHINKG